MLSITTRNALGQDLSRRTGLKPDDLLPLLSEFAQQRGGEAHIVGKMKGKAVDLHLGPEAVTNFLQGITRRQSRHPW